MDSRNTSRPMTEFAASPAPTRRGVWIVRLVMAVLWTLAILMMCWLPRDLLQSVEGKSSFFEIPNLDKIVHWGIFAIFSILWLRLGESRWRYGWVAFAGFALGAITEIVQTLPVIGRDGDVTDFLTDVCGVVIGLAVARLVEPLLRLSESVFFPRSTA